ncbi:MAG: tripartite tricarboxylate transporter TctB family protein [Betaproteobacteria bacterium]|nr:MAG: tripartite tricarboxylate transporter TctB family protein [Betaproteobacteria bacterium]
MGAHVTLRAPLEEEPRMKIRSQKDFWSGLMFIGSGLFFALWAMAFYQMGTAVRMGPAYFPTMLGFLLTVLGAAVLLQSLAMEPEGDQAVHTPFNIIDLLIVVAIYAVLILLSQNIGSSSDYAILGGTIIVSLLTAVFRPDAKPLVLVTAATIAYGYLMKPLGLVIATAALVFISAAGGHEFKWKEVIILFIILILFSVLVFVKGLTLPFPIWPEYFG